jgi:hypothetical protein
MNVDIMGKEESKKFVIPDKRIKKEVDLARQYIKDQGEILNNLRDKCDNLLGDFWKDSDGYTAISEMKQNIQKLIYLYEDEKTNIESIVLNFLELIVNSGVKLNLPQNWLDTECSKKTEEMEGYFSQHVFDEHPMLQIDSLNSATEPLSGTVEGLFGNSFVRTTGH